MNYFKYSFIAIAFMLFFSSASAKDVTVVFNFPSSEHEDIVSAVSLQDDANAFNSFLTVASANSLDLNMTYYGESMGWFVNGINGLNNNWPDAYWHFWVNSAEASLGISSYVPENNDVIELGYENEALDLDSIAFERAISWLVSNQKQSGEIGSHAVWGNAFALMALSLVEGKDTVKNNAIDYLYSNQYENAGFGYPGYGADVGHSAVVTMALFSNGKKLSDFSKNNSTTIDYILSNQQNDGGFSSWGDSDIDSTAWAVLAIAQSGTNIPTKNGNTSADFILDTQNSDGGFGYNKSDSSKEDFTAEALLALKSMNQEKNQKVENAIQFLNSKKNQDNCFSNSYTTALAIIAFNAWDERYSGISDCLKTLQLSDGGFSRNALAGSNSVDTAVAAIALKSKTLPLTVSQTDADGLIPLNSIIKFSVKIKNTGRIKATNVSILLQGIPLDWIDNESSTTSISSIMPGETKTATIFARAKDTGIFSVHAEASAAETAEKATSNSLDFETASALLEASISMD